MSSDMEFRERLLLNLYNAIRSAHGGETVNACPHCEEIIISPIYPLDPLIICTCGYCEQYVIPFAGLLLPISKSICESGEPTDLRLGIIQAIMKCLHEGVQKLVGTNPIANGDIGSFVDQVRIQADENILPVIPDSLDDLELLWNDEPPPLPPDEEE